MNMANDADRLRSSIDRELAMLSGRRARLDWLAEHLVEYVDRLRGFAAMPRLSLQEVVGSGLFTVVSLAVERLGVELEGSEWSGMIADVLERLKSTVSELRARSSQEELDRLESLVRELRTIVPG